MPSQLARRTVLGSSLALPAAALLTQRATASMPATEKAMTLEVAASDMDSSNQAGWWSPLDTYVGGNEYAYLAYNTAGNANNTHGVAIARRSGTDVGVWNHLRVLDGTHPAQFVDDGGHNQPSLARDGSGRFHVFASMHNNAWRYFRSHEPGAVPTNHSAEMPDFGPGVTYPIAAAAPNGDIYLMVRLDDDARDRRPGRLYRWDNERETWSRVTTFAEAPSRSVYPDDLEVDADGNVHLLFEWSRFPSERYRHQLSYLKYVPAQDRFVNSRGEPQAVPVTPSTADVVQALEAGESYQDGNDDIAMQSAKMTIGGDRRPSVAYRFSPTTQDRFDVRYATVVGGAWHTETVHSGGNSQSALDVTWDPEEWARVYYVLKSGDDRVFVATKVGGSWQSSSIAPGVPIGRLSVDHNASGKDIVYLVAPNEGMLYYTRR